MNDSVYISFEEAFNFMIQATKANTPFKAVFVKENGDLKIISKALLRKSTPKAKDQNTQFKFNLIDTVNSNYASSYIPMLISVDDKKILL